MIAFKKNSTKKYLYLEKFMRKFNWALPLLLVPLLSYATSPTPFHIIGDSSQLISGSGIATGSNFTMFDKSGNVTPPGRPEIWASTNDIIGTLDDSLICTSEDCTDYAMTLESTGPTKFSGGIWAARNIRVFAPGTYTIETCPPPIDENNVAVDGSTNCAAQLRGESAVTFTVGAGQLGIHMLFDYPIDAPIDVQNLSIDVIEVVSLNSAFTVPGLFLTSPFPIPEDTRIYSLASIDVGSWLTGSTTVLSQGIPGIRMVDGPFGGFRANFNIFLDAPLTPPPTNITVTAGTIDGNVVDTSASVTLSSGTGFATGTTFDWSASDTELLALVASTTGQTITFDPSTLTSFENIVARVTATTGSLSASDRFIMRMGCIASTQAGIDSDGDGTDDDAELCTDGDNDGVLDYLDADNNNATTISTVLNAEEATTGAGTFVLGDTAAFVTDSNSNLGAGIVVTVDDLGPDVAVDSSCVGGCFDFVVTGLAGAGSVQVVLPLSVGIPTNSEYRKFVDGSWRGFSEDANNKVDSAAKVAGVCPAPGSVDYTDQGLVAGNECIQLTIEDNGPNDTDSAVDTIADPSGVSESTEIVIPPLETKIGGGALGLYSLLVMFIALSLRRKMS